MTSYPSNTSMMVHSGYGVNDVYSSLILNCMNAPEVPVLRKNAASAMTRELHPVMVELKDPRQRLVTAFGRPVNVAFALAEVLWILAGRDDVEMLKAYNSTIANYSDDGLVFNAPYGWRMRHAFGFDQLEDIIRTLGTDPTSRQAVMSIWCPEDDRGFEAIQVDDEHIEMRQREVKDRACNLVSHALIRNDRLDWTQVMRSNDALWGVPYNWMQWMHIQEYVAWRLGIQPGMFYHIADSFHIYDHQYSDANTIEHFDIYEFLPRHQPICFGDIMMMRQVQMMENQIRHGARVDVSNDMDVFWRTCLYIWQAHHFYTAKEDEYCFALLEAVPDRVYAAAQMRFYWTMRWHKTAFNAAAISVIFPPKVAAWIMGESL